MRNLLRVLAFDVAAPLATIAALFYLGMAMGWPLWWVSLGSVLCALIVEAVVVNIVLARRDGVTVGTDDDRPGLRLLVVGLATLALAAAVLVGYNLWTLPDRNLHDDSTEVIGIASSVAEASATFTPQNPTESIDKAAAQMTPQRGEQYKTEFAAAAKELTAKNVSGHVGKRRIGARRRDQGQRRGTLVGELFFEFLLNVERLRPRDLESAPREVAGLVHREIHRGYQEK